MCEVRDGSRLCTCKSTLICLHVRLLAVGHVPSSGGGAQD